ncbi:MAG: hypothetical protein KDA92_18635, partial [Planctomycetales bacterium]|nr:hypothetical protein [Planctomycetales bacterium]
IVAIPHDSAFSWKMVLVISILTMTLGNVAALWQSNVRRMMAYSSIAHAGYLLIGLATAMGLNGGEPLGNAAVGATLMYVVVYSLASVGVFASLGYLSDTDHSCDTVESLGGVGRLHPMMGGMCAICLFSLAGIPPLAGFWGKFTLFRSALDAGLQAGDVSQRSWFLALCILGVINAAVAAAYYLRLIAALYFQPSVDGSDALPSAGNTGAGLAAIFSGLLVVLIGIRTGGALTGTRSAADALWTGGKSPAVSANVAPAEASVALERNAADTQLTSSR